MTKPSVVMMITALGVGLVALGCESETPLALDSTVTLPSSPSFQLGRGAIRALETVHSENVLISAATRGTSTATCPEGKSVLGGGYSVEAEATPDLNLLGVAEESWPSSTSGWEVTYFNRQGSVGIFLTVYALCAVA